MTYFTSQKSPFTYLEFECQNATCFSEKAEKIFLKRLFVSKTSPHLFLLGEEIWGQVIPKKGKKTCPPEVASKEF